MLLAGSMNITESPIFDRSVGKLQCEICKNINNLEVRRCKCHFYETVHQYESEDSTDTEIDNEESIDMIYPDYSYMNRVNFLYTKIDEDRKEKYQCYLCNFATRHLTSLRVHFLRHTNTRTYNCIKCSFTARSKFNLKRHMLYRCGKPKFTYIGEYKCDLCEYASPLKGNLQRHQRCHTREKPFACSQCDYRAAAKGSVKKHKLTHTKREKTFACEQCKRSYVNKCDLIIHIQSKHVKV